MHAISLGLQVPGGYFSTPNPTMTDSSLGRKNQKITDIATPTSVEKAEKALQRLGFESKTDFAKSQLLARNTVTKFFQRQPIQLGFFCTIVEDFPGDRSNVLIDR